MDESGTAPKSVVVAGESKQQQQQQQQHEAKPSDLRQRRQQHGGQFKRDTSTGNSLMLHHDSLELARKALGEQRKDLYRRLKGIKGHKGLPKEDLESYFDAFGILQRKRRKRKLSNMVWSVDEKSWKKSNARSGGGTMNSQDAQSTGSARIVLACLEPTDIDWAMRWRQHRVRENILFSLRATLEALNEDRTLAKGRVRAVVRKT